METPSSVLFTDLRTFGITNRDAASVLLSDSVMYGAVSPRKRIYDKSFLSRKVVHAQPQDMPPLADSTVAALKLSSRILKPGENRFTLQEIVEHYAGPACERMGRSLEAYGSHGAGTFYRNTVQRIMVLDLECELNRAILLVVLFIIVGSTGDARQAAQLTEAIARKKLGVDFGTLETTSAARVTQTRQPVPALALLRTIDGVVRPPLFTLSTDEPGTIVGCMPSGPSTIADVDADVSREHLRIWFEDGNWYVQDLGSTKGTSVISGATRQTIVVAPPRRDRDREARTSASEPVRISNSDVICLGATTRFLVLSAGI